MDMSGLDREPTVAPITRAIRDVATPGGQREGADEHAHPLFGSRSWTVPGMTFGAGTLVIAVMIFPTRKWRVR